jgi:hypothetical protein
MVKINLLTSGGLGDAAMSFAKIHARFSDYLDKIFVTHIRVRDDNLYDTIHEFYNTQEIKNEVIKVPSWDWQPQNRNKYDFFLGNNWTKENHNDESSWKIKSFPQIKYSKIEGIFTLLNPSSGGVKEGTKYFNKKKVEDFLEKHPETILIGRGNEKNYEDIPNSLYNKTSISELVNLIASADTVISPEGFVAYFAGMCGKRVFVKNDNTEAIYKRKHPDWNMNLVSGVEEIL